MADHYFVGDVDNSWSNGSNWSSSSGGAGGAGVPGSGDRAIFDTNSPDCSMDINSSLYHLELRSDFAGKVDCVNRYIRAEYDIHVDGGELDLGTSSAHWFKRYLTRSGSGVITPGTSTIQARYDDTRSTLYTEGDFTLYNFNCEVVTAGTFYKYTTLNLGGGTITVENSLDLPGKNMYGDRTYSLHNGTIELHGNLTNSDNGWTSGTAEVKLVGTGDQNFAYKGNYHFTIDKPSGSAIATRFSCDTGGRGANPEPDITFDDSVDWLTNNIRAYFYAIERGGQGTVKMEIYGPTQTFYQAWFHVESDWGDYSHRIDLKGNTHHCNSHVWVYTDYKNRSAYINNGTIEVDGNMYVDIEDSDARNGSAVFKMTGDVDRIISFTGGTNKYWNELRIAKSGGAKVTLNNNMSCLNDNIYIDSGILDLNGKNVSASGLIVNEKLMVKGSETISATVTYNASSVLEYYDDGVVALINRAGSTIRNIVFAGGKTHQITASTTISITGAISVNGSDVNKAILRSTSDGTQANLNCSSEQYVLFIDAKDNNATGETIYSYASTDSGNLTNWNTITGTTLYFVGDVDTYWSNADNWSESSGGAGGDGVPVVGIVAILDSNSTDVYLDIDAECDQIVMQSNYIGSVHMNSNNIVSDVLTINHQGSVYNDNNAGQFVISSAFINNGKIFTLTSDSLKSSGLVNNGLVVPIVKVGWKNIPRSDDKHTYKSRIEPQSSVIPY